MQRFTGLIGMPDCVPGVGSARRGGAIAFADPDRRMSFACSPSRMSPVSDIGPWATALIEAVYACVG
jgi:hypothetical protein